jgi:hypothetical protein
VGPVGPVGPVAGSPVGIKKNAPTEDEQQQHIIKTRTAIIFGSIIFVISKYFFMCVQMLLSLDHRCTHNT